MNRKIILLPLVLSALVLAGCGETGTSSTSSSEETPTSSETTSSSEEVPSSSSTTESETSNPEEETWSTIADLKTMDIGASFTARAYWMGTCGMINEQYGTYNTSYVADGAEGYIIYRGEASKIDALELEVGKTVVEFTGTIANYVDEKSGSTTYECSLNTITVVEDATGLEAPVMLTLNAANPTFTFDATTASRRVVINDAKVVSNETGNHDNVTVTFTVGTDTTKYTIFFDSRYTDTSLVADLKAGDTFNCESFVGRSRFESIDKLVITSEGGSTEEPGDETITPLADVINMADDTTFTTRAYYVGRNSKAAEKGIMTYNAVYVADGATAYMIYNHSQEKIDALNLVPGESIVEFSGKVANFGGLYECRADSIKVITDATGLEAPVYQTLDKDHADIDLGSVLVSTKFNVSDALVKKITTSGNDTTITFTVGEGTKEYGLLLDSRYNDMTPVEDLKAGDTFKTETFLNVEDGAPMFTYIANFAITAEGEGGSTEEPDPEPEPLPTPVDTTIAEALTGELSKTTLYRVTGVIEQMKGDQYGNAMLVDPETGDYITVYGNTTSMSAFTVTNGEVSYTNPKDAETTLADIHDGDKITVLCVYDYFQWTDTHELLCVTTEHAAYDGTVAVTMPTEIANATATASKTEAAWGEDITITVTPGENYAVTSVKVDHGYTTETLTAAPYTFKARCINNVTVELRDASVVSESLTIVADNVPATYNDEQTFTVDGVVFKSNNLAGSYGNGIQTKIDAFIYNETALPKAIDNIVFTFSEKQTSTASADSVNFGTSVMTEVGEENNLVMFDGETATITVDCDVEGATFFRIDHTLKGMICLESIVINYAA